MVLGWEIIASCVSTGVAILALFVSLRQGRMANRQNLFDRRLRIWIITEKLMQLYRINSELLKKDNEAQFTIDLCFERLTNTTYLQEISAAISHVLESGHQLRLHLKLDEMKSLSMEATFVFKGQPKTTIAEFIDAYQALLFTIYQYQIILNEMQANKAEALWSLEERYREELYQAEDRLTAAYEKLAGKRLIGKIRRQIRLDSTLVDYLNTFR